VGATPTPATNACAWPRWEVFRLPACKTGVAKQVSEVTTGALPAPPTSLRQGFGLAGHFRIRSSTSQSNPLSAGRLRVRVPSGPPFYRSVAQSSERAAWDREVAGGNPAVPTNLRSLSYGSASHFKLLPWPTTGGIRLLSGLYAGGTAIRDSERLFLGHPIAGLGKPILPAAPINH
jgi:hypothetical protein